MHAELEFEGPQIHQLIHPGRHARVAALCSEKDPGQCLCDNNLLKHGQVLLGLWQSA